MKKLTAGIFATILGVTAMGAADAAVTSKGYVDAALATKANASEVSTLSSTVAGHTTDIAGLKSADTTLQGNIDTLAGKVGEVPAGKNVIGIIDEKTSGIASESTVSELSGRVDALETASATHATKTELETATNDMATQTWVKDQGYATSQGVTTVLADYATKTEAQDYANAKDAAIQAAQADATQALTNAATADGKAVAAQGEVDALELVVAGKANSADVYTTTQADAKFLTSANLETYATKAEAKGYADAKDAAISAAQTAATAADGKAVAAQGTADDALGKANTNATAITTLQAFDNSIKTATEGSVDGTYTLTMKKTGDEMTFGWELIQRDGENK